LTISFVWVSAKWNPGSEHLIFYSPGRFVPGLVITSYNFLSRKRSSCIGIGDTQHVPFDPLKNRLYHNKDNQLTLNTNDVPVSPKTIYEIMRCHCSGDFSSQRSSCTCYNIACCMCTAHLENDEILFNKQNWLCLLKHASNVSSDSTNMAILECHISVMSVIYIYIYIYSLLLHSFMVLL